MARRADWRGARGNVGLPVRWLCGAPGTRAWACGWVACRLGCSACRPGALAGWGDSSFPPLSLLTLQALNAGDLASVVFLRIEPRCMVPQPRGLSQPQSELRIYFFGDPVGRDLEGGLSLPAVIAGLGRCGKVLVP